MTQTVTDTPQPTTDQCLHSIALSLIEINRVMQGAKRTQTKAFRHAKREAVMINRRSMELPEEPKKSSFWANLWPW